MDELTDEPTDELTNKVVVVTGASSGIGEATVLHLAQRGARLVIGARRKDRLDELAARVEAAHGRGRVVARTTDVRNADDVSALVETAQQHFGRLDVLFSNAGTMAVSAMDETRVGDWEEMIDVNVKGLLYGVAAALPVFREQRSGHFVHTASTAAYRIVPTMAVYAATKTAVKVVTEGLRQEAGPHLRVTLISPGFTDTEGVGRGASPEVAAALVAQRDEIAMPPDAIARAVAYAIEQPGTVDVGEIVVRPTAQG